MMILKGVGDPSRGHGGYSFLKLPLKASQDSLSKGKNLSFFVLIKFKSD
jgi:hypothetical protein